MNNTYWIVDSNQRTPVIIDYIEGNFNMKLYDLLKITQEDYDTYDTQYCASITVCFIDEETDNYDKFCNKLYKKVNVKGADKNILDVNWSEFIEHNYYLFEEFARKWWISNYTSDKDELIYEWIEELNKLCAGYGNEGVYEKLIELLNKCYEV